MTMPQYSNCAHQGKGWCLSCVIDLFDASFDAVKYHREQSELKDKEITELRAEIDDLWQQCTVLQHEMDCMNGIAEYGN